MKKLLLIGSICLISVLALINFGILPKPFGSWNPIERLENNNSLRDGLNEKLDCLEVANSDGFPLSLTCFFLDRPVKVMNIPHGKFNTDRNIYCGSVKHDEVAIHDYVIFYPDFALNDQIPFDPDYVNQLKNYVGDNYSVEVPVYDNGEIACG